MSDVTTPIVLIVDEDVETQLVARHYLSGAGLRTVVAHSRETALRVLETLDLLIGRCPDVVLSAAHLPDGSGAELCGQIHRIPRLARTPVVFASIDPLNGEGASLRAAGAAEVLGRPLDCERLLATVRRLMCAAGPESVDGARPKEEDRGARARTFQEFKAFVAGQAKASPADQEAVSRIAPSELYRLCAILSRPAAQVARWVAEFLGLPFLPSLDASTLDATVLPSAFCTTNLVAPIRPPGGMPTFVLANPFQWDVLEALERTKWWAGSPAVAISEPETVLIALMARRPKGREVHSVPDPVPPELQKRRSITRRIMTDGMTDAPVLVRAVQTEVEPPPARPKSEGSTNGRLHTLRVADDTEPPSVDDAPALRMANEILRAAVKDRASDIHIEPKDDETVLRFRIDGDMQPIRSIANDVAPMVVSRLKALAGMDIAERRRPQDGVVEAEIDSRLFRLRLATTSTPYGESLIVRLLEPLAKPRTSTELGMSVAQARTLADLSNRSQGLLLVVGTTGAGKSTTIHSLLSHVDGKTRSILSVEDPIEYKIPAANQQQVNERANLTFPSLLKSAMRQDPDVLFVGEIRDFDSAKASMDFASSGHLTITTLHAAHSTAAIFRLERLGIHRTTMAEALLAILAQKLFKVLCPECKKIGPITDEEAALLAPFTSEVPTSVAKPTGCPACRGKGYRGRTGAFELLPFDPEIVEMVRNGASVPQIRAHTQRQGNILISSNTIDKVRDLLITPRDAYEGVLMEEMEYRPAPTLPVQLPPPPPPPATPAPSPHRSRSDRAEAASLLVVDDDPDTLALIERNLQDTGHEIVTCSDAVDALLHLARRRFRLLLLDVGLPDLDGMKLVEILSQKGIETTVLLMTALSEAELQMRSAGLGHVEYLRKPIAKDVLLERVRHALRLGPSGEA